MNEINLNSLKIFLEVANSNSFLEASNKLYMSQPAISKSMSKLEETLNVKLFYQRHFINTFWRNTLQLFKRN